MKLIEIIAWVLYAALAVAIAFMSVHINGMKFGILGFDLINVEGLKPQRDAAIARAEKLAGDLAASELELGQCMAANQEFEAAVKDGALDAAKALATERAACDARVARTKKALQAIEKVTHAPTETSTGASDLIGAGELRDAVGQPAP